MEHSLSSLRFKGSIPEAIAEAKTQRKLLVVYISGGNAESDQLEQSTWTNINVAEAVNKHCILLHLSEGSIDAAHFSAIYPQNHIPCVTAIGYNGVQLWKLEGYIEAGVLVSNLEKGWLDIHLQQTAASVISAALASETAEPSPPGTSNATSSSQEGIAVTDVLPQSQSNDDSESEGKNENRDRGQTLEEKTEMDGGGSGSRIPEIRNSENVGSENATPPIKAAEEVSSSTSLNLENSTDAMTSASGCSPMEEINSNRLAAPIEEQKHAEENTSLPTAIDEAADMSKHDHVHKSSDVHFNIRLPNSTSLQERFALTSTLRMVQEYVDEHLASEISHYDLAIPYPRKTFSDEDLNKSLLELGLSDRQALIVVPHRNANHNRGVFASQRENSSSSADNSVGGSGGYFAHVKRILSFINPLSYVAGASSSTSQQEAQTDPNPGLRNNLVGTETPYSPNQTNRNSNPTNGNEGRARPQSSRFGSNIHTLRWDEDDNKPFGDGNAFWNGNSTQFGGNNDGK